MMSHKQYYNYILSDSRPFQIDIYPITKNHLEITQKNGPGVEGF